MEVEGQVKTDTTLSNTPDIPTYRRALDIVLEEMARMEKALQGRDEFIVSKGLWPEFVAQVEVTRP
jgi:hypothetical protein